MGVNNRLQLHDNQITYDISNFALKVCIVRRAKLICVFSLIMNVFIHRCDINHSAQMARFRLCFKRSSKYQSGVLSASSRHKWQSGR